MNYLTEIKLFYDWLGTHKHTPSAIALWHGLMYTANRSGWEDSMVLPISVIESRTQLSRSAIYRERKRLVETGLLRYIEREGRQSSIYNICSFEKRVVSQSETQSETQNKGILLINKTKLRCRKGKYKRKRGRRRVCSDTYNLKKQKSKKFRAKRENEKDSFQPCNLARNYRRAMARNNAPLA